MSNILVIYYTQGICTEQQYQSKSNTETVVDIIQDTVGADVFKLEVEGDYIVPTYWHTDKSKLKGLNKIKSNLKNHLNDISRYDIIFVCGPCWWGTYPPAILSQLNVLDFTGKKVIGFVTHEGSGPDGCIEDLVKYCKGADFGNSLTLFNTEVFRSIPKIKRWVLREIESIHIPPDDGRFDEPPDNWRYFREPRIGD